MFYYTPQDNNTSKMSITWTQTCLGMERCKNDRAKGRLGDKIEEVLLVLAAFKTLGQFDVFRIELLMSLPQQKPNVSDALNGLGFKARFRAGVRVLGQGFGFRVQVLWA
jgi:hypothetical protein